MRDANTLNGGINITIKFQNRKRYGGMRDWERDLKEGVIPMQGFKTVNGMEACATVALKSGLATR